MRWTAEIQTARTVCLQTLLFLEYFRPLKKEMVVALFWNKTYFFRIPFGNEWKKRSLIIFKWVKFYWSNNKWNENRSRTIWIRCMEKWPFVILQEHCKWFTHQPFFTGQEFDSATGAIDFENAIPKPDCLTSGIWLAMQMVWGCINMHIIIR